MNPSSPVIEDHNGNVTLSCDVQSGNPSKLLKVQWMMNGDLLKELPECYESEEDTENFCKVDPTKMLLQNVNQEFLGNYSCRGYNVAGWGDESGSDYLDVYNEPGTATVSHLTTGKSSLFFLCSIHVIKETNNNNKLRNYL